MKTFAYDAIETALEDYRVRGWEGIEAFAGLPPWELPKIEFRDMCEYVADVQAAYVRVAHLDVILEERANAYEKGGMGGRAVEHRDLAALIRAVRGQE